MKKFIKIAELGLVSIFMIGTIMRLFELTGGGILTVLSLSALSLFYLTFGFAIFSNIKFKKKKNKEISEKQNPLFVIAGVIIGAVASMACSGILFKIMLWPGSGMLLFLSIVSFAIFFLIFIAIKLINKSSDSFYMKMIVRTSIFLLVVSSLYSISMNTLVDILYRKQPQYAEMMKESLANPTDETIRIKMDVYRDSLENSRYNQ
ncbi:hypothetical protein Fleli_3465 [Bernardetia litoralis DSM 6794]|uniref:Uncharacterized protein n=1 Tax=Bernardetia litoralis (strain ATCC 23117 / DSM 6794 / NBRC 15988 / NCIMB 1366 / Fx l1 / Sio-4) TaxID=880071 RepID=I4APA0_BERLS|nr:hypothetical protein [Bernardetia litoralis]AFM05785.1 hypothetical protein Fleli_3465 [Bernardetia litoralis DSM 6794]